jgi:rare lipoprotein A
MIEVTRRVATLLAMPSSGGTRVRLQILPRESHEAADAMPDAPKLAVTAAPRGEVQQSDLPLPGSAATVTARAAPVAAPEKAAPAALPETRLPESLTQGVADPGNLYVQLSTFHNVQYADIQRARVGGLGARIVSESDGRLQTHRVIIGPFTTVQQADVALDQVLRAGVTDARIVVE